ncbi:GntR family transcriptional regulator [Paraburkholderia hospita]|uniref:GntR family transcriptional regulator n=1 Tax=Paraburkholderia hospita TaxID=169430 RepID=A0ABP2PY70_9BURK|nr:GntR family transcriptional regulator [Paraburkholderia hospita]EIN02762.1 GntR family transcriptional regulator [Paraburkholderia hospita]OUL89625.1 GntR family transcriptional regulator [Paraburkholderia hospita]
MDTKIASPKSASRREKGTATLTVAPVARQARVVSDGEVKTPLRGALMGLTVESHEPIGKQIFRSLREAIFTGLLAPGTPLSEKEVSEMFQVSRQPVREAFIKLVEAGVLQVLPQRGTFVKRISPRKVREGRFIREAIEAAVVRKAAVAITDAQLAELAANLREQKVAAKVNDTAAFLACDEQFHFLIAQSIDCVAAWETIQDIKAQMDRVRYLSLHEVSPLDLLIKQHALIVSGLKAHDPDAAENAMRAHLREILVSLGPVAQLNPDWFEPDEPETVRLML